MDVTFLLIGSTVLAMVTPLVGALLRMRGRGPQRATAGLGADVAERSSGAGPDVPA